MNQSHFETEHIWASKECQIASSPENHTGGLEVRLGLHLCWTGGCCPQRHFYGLDSYQPFLYLTLQLRYDYIRKLIFIRYCLDLPWQRNYRPDLIRSNKLNLIYQILEEETTVCVHYYKEKVQIVINMLQYIRCVNI